MSSTIFNTYISGTGKKAETQTKINQLNPDVWNSIIFDEKRHSIWAQGKEYGCSTSGMNNFIFTYTYNSAYTTSNNSYINNDGNNTARAFVTSVTYYLDDDSFKISYSYAYESSLKLTGNSGDFVNGMSVSGHNIAYSYGTFTYEDTGSNNAQYRVVTNANLSNNGKLSYSTTDISTTSGTQSNYTGKSDRINNNTYARVLTNISQRGDGKISYTYQDISSNISLSNSTTTDNYPAVVMLYQDNSGNITYYSRDLSVNSGTKNTNTTITYSTSLNVLTGIRSDASGKISYTYNQLNTTHSSNGTSNSGNHVITNIKLNENGDLSYTYYDISSSYSNDFITGITQAKYGKLTSITGGKFGTNDGTQAAHSTYVTGVSIGSDGKISYSYADINHTGSVSGDFVSDVQISKRGTISGTAGTFNTQGHEKTTDQSYIITYTYIDHGGKLHYDYRDLTGSGSADFLTGWSQSADGKVTITGNSFDTQNSGNESDGFVESVELTDGTLTYVKEKLSISDAGEDSSKIFINGIELNNDGKGFTYTYSSETTLSINDSTATTDKYISALSVNNHGITVTKENLPTIQLSGNNSSGTYIASISASGHTISYTKGTFPTLSVGNAGSGDFINGISVSNHNITYSYGSFSSLRDTNYGTTGWIKNVNLDSNGALSYSYQALTVDYGEQILNNRSTYLINGIEINDKGTGFTYTYSYIEVKLESHDSGNVVSDIWRDSSDNHKLHVTYSTVYSDPFVYMEVANPNKGLEISYTYTYNGNEKTGTASVANLNADKVDGYHIVVTSTPGNDIDTIYFII